MHYMTNYYEMRMDPRIMHPGTKSIICVALSYVPQQTLSDDQYQIAYYAYGQDYHIVLRNKLYELAKVLPISQSSPRICVDSAPILERFWAQQAGIGWIGKNKNLIVPNIGSFVVLGEILTDLELDYDTPMKCQCGNCKLCVSLCPAIQSPDQLFCSEKCHSYNTIEKPLKVPSLEVATNYTTRLTTIKQKYIYGCDQCQLVCPHNKNIKPTQEPMFSPNKELLDMTKEDWHNLTKEQYNQLFRKSAVKRVKYPKLINNIDLQKNNEYNNKK